MAPGYGCGARSRCRVLTRLLKPDLAPTLEEVWARGARSWDSRDTLGMTAEETALGGANRGAAAPPSGAGALRGAPRGGRSPRTPHRSRCTNGQPAQSRTMVAPALTVRMSFTAPSAVR
jgi:hypothetical protein